MHRRGGGVEDPAQEGGAPQKHLRRAGKPQGPELGTAHRDPGRRSDCDREPEEDWQKVRLPDGREGVVRASYLDTYYENPIDLPEAELRRRLVETAKLYEGTHYRWGGKSPLGIDCSGLVSTSYLLNGIIIHRDASLKEGFPVREIPREELKMGDLIFFPGHVAMYIENGDYIHSTLTEEGGELGFGYSLDVNTSLASENTVTITVRQPEN